MIKTLAITTIGIISSGLVYVGYTAASNPQATDDKLHFAFELVRHGARAPSNATGYDVEKDQLTREGMRQRYLLGAYNRQRYVEQYKILSPELDPKQIATQTTTVFRTFQSGYSELMGLYPPSLPAGSNSTSPNLTTLTANETANLVKASPPFSVTNEAATNQGLGISALPHNYTQLPIYSFLPGQNQTEVLVDDIDLYGCDYVVKVDGRFPLDSTYTSVWWLMDDLKLPMQKCFNLTADWPSNIGGKNDTFMELYHKCDIVQSRTFAPLQVCDTDYKLTATELGQCDQVVLATLVLPLSDPVKSRNMYISKQLRKPLALMDDIVDNKEVPTKFMMYSAHDWTVATMQMFFDSSNGNFTVVPYASQYQIELHSTEACEAEDCYWVELYNNGVLQEFRGSNGCLNPGQCSYTEFKNVLKLKGFIETNDWANQCATPFTPAEFSPTWIEHKMRGIIE